ncbi:alkaline protease secretion ATP-binding protein AprD [Jeongeupia sp. HS-3]|uniref:type I secretion system permease/ATPase n=1 Tax=Jeongeupia sp. HS-3 TaxID=1009682 RepID=UPI0018A67484|nr:type I secretion system permease/ATPase [Jeongeupia sp. HS-3]BCL74567.1 alkaline protease secretion ATP-binding protein AprD [Jeongeupia sp. HS-3]
MNSRVELHGELGGVLREFKRTFWVLAAFSATINVLMLTPSVYMLQVYDRVLVSRNVSTLLMLSVMVCGLYMLMSFMELARSIILIRVGNQLDMALNQRIFNAAFERSLRRAGGNPAQALQDLTQVRQFLTGNGLFAFFDAPWTPIYLLATFLIHPILGLMTLAGSIILFGLTWLTEYATSGPLAEANKAAIASGAYANNNLRNAEVIEAMGMLPIIRERWFEGHRRILEQQTLASDSAARISGVTRFVRIALQSLSLGVGALLAIENKISPGMMIACSILIGRALGPVELAIGSWRQWLGCRAAWGRLDILLREFPPQLPRMPLPKPKGAICLEAVSVAAPGGGQAVLRGISFSLPVGEMLGVIGPSGAGKSTLARLLVGVLTAQQGKVRLDGVDVAQWPREELGAWIGYLPQDVELFEGTVAENIARFNPVDSDAVIAAATMAGVHELILRLPLGYETLLNADGSPLSGGQKQRIGLARAIYGESSLIVLDEPNANLDDAGEGALLQALKALKHARRTVVLISHRPAVLGVVDQVLVLADGGIKMFGPRDEVFNALRQANVIAAAGSAVALVRE